MSDVLASSPLVLVVEDDADAREMYKVLLEESGFRVAAANNGIDGIDRAQTLHPQLILMDLSLPSIDGLEASRRLKAETTTRDIPIVALSGNPIDDPGGRRLFAATLLKPCLPDDLLAEVRRHLRGVHN